MGLGPLELFIVLVIVLVLFGGRGRISSVFGELGSGIASFRKGLKEGTEDDKQLDEGKKE